MDRSLVIDMPRDKRRAVQATSLRLSRPGDLEKAVTSFVGNMNARLDGHITWQRLVLCC
jgi:hypothetical protein